MARPGGTVTRIARRSFQTCAWSNRPGRTGRPRRPRLAVERRTLEAAPVVTRLAGTWKLHPTAFHLKDVPYHPPNPRRREPPVRARAGTACATGGEPETRIAENLPGVYLVESPGLDQEAAATAAGSLSAGPWRRRGIFRLGWL